MLLRLHGHNVGHCDASMLGRYLRCRATTLLVSIVIVLIACALRAPIALYAWGALPIYLN